MCAMNDSSDPGPKPLRPTDIPSDEEILAMEIFEDRRLREMGIDPDGDPIDIMMEVRRQAMEQRRKEVMTGLL
jgi:hypothetical protein